MNTRCTRRHFLRHHAAAALAVAAFPAIVPAAVLGRAGKATPGGRVTLGCIGVGPQGRAVLGGFLSQPDVQVVALADVARQNLDAALRQVGAKYGHRDCQAFGDYRELLARKDIDAVLVATPDHWHVPVALAAVKAGKDLYLEKPMGLAVAEDQLLRQAVRKHQRVFQFGTQQRSSAEFYKACALVRAGRIGQLKQINVWCSGSRPGGSTAPAPVPDGLDYETWLGPARFSPFTVDKCFDDAGAGRWKTWWHNYDYALGFIAGWGVHPLDIAYWGYPAMMHGHVEITGQGIIPTEGACNTAVAWEVDMTFADGVRLKYKATRNGFDRPTPLADLQAWQDRYGRIADHGTAFEGTDGWIEVHRGGLKTHPEGLVEEPIVETDPGLLRSQHHQQNFVEAVRDRGRTVCPIEDAVQADILCHLSDIAVRLNRPLTWDPKRERFVKDTEANRKLALRPMRQPWRFG